jgi:hypothetical protein
MLLESDDLPTVACEEFLYLLNDLVGVSLRQVVSRLDVASLDSGDNLLVLGHNTLGQTVLEGRVVEPKYPPPLVKKAAAQRSIIWIPPSLCDGSMEIAICSDHC